MQRRTMETRLHSRNGQEIAEITDEHLRINDASDFLGVLASLPSHRVVLHQRHLHPDFFDLRTGLAGEILQKVVNYQVRLAVVGDFAHYESKSLRDFLYQANRGNRSVFVSSLEEALERMAV